MDQIKAFSYLRVSGKGQVCGDGFPRQRDVCERYAAENNILIEREFRDEGVCGADEMNDRPGLSDLLEAIAANGVRLILIERHDRLARDLMVGELIYNELRKMGVKVVAAESGQDLTVGDDNNTNRLIRQIMGAIAQWEKCGIVLKLKAARLRKRKECGRCEGQKPYGHYPGEQTALEHIIAWREKGMHIHDIVQRLRDERVPARGKDAQWHATTVQRILQRQTNPKPVTA